MTQDEALKRFDYWLGELAYAQAMVDRQLEEAHADEFDADELLQRVADLEKAAAQLRHQIAGAL